MLPYYGMLLVAMVMVKPIYPVLSDTLVKKTNTCTKSSDHIPPVMK